MKTDPDFLRNPNPARFRTRGVFRIRTLRAARCETFRDSKDKAAAPMKSDGFEVFAPGEPYLLNAGEAARR